MNGQNNNGSQFPFSLSNKENTQAEPTQKTKNKFFPEELLSDDVFKNVNSASSSNANSQFISHTTWEVGKNNNSNQGLKNSLNDSYPSPTESPEVLNLFDENIETLVNDVNATNNTNSNVPPVSPSTISAPKPVKEIVNPSNNEQPPLITPLPDQFLNEQPLSMGALGAVPLNPDEAPKEVVETSKYFNQDVSQTIMPPPAPISQPTNPLDRFEQPAPIIDEIKIAKEFVGPSYQKITMAPFSFAGFIFGSIYFLYRKMYITGIIIFIIDLVLQNLLKSPISYIAVFIFHLVIALTVNQLYLKIVSKRIKKIVKQNPKKNEYEISQIAKKRGGTSLLLAIIISIGLSVVASVTFGIYKLSDYFDKFTTNLNNEQITEYNGVLVYESFNIDETFNITIPAAFSNKSNNDILTYEYIPDSNETLNSCELSFGAIKGYTSGETLIKQIAQFNNDSEGVTTLESKNITWYNFYTENSLERIYYRGTTINNKALLLSYSIGQDVTSDICDTYYVEILDSISKKNEN